MAVTVFDTRTAYATGQEATGWATIGGGSIAQVSADPAPVEGTGCYGIAVSTATNYLYYSSGTPVDLTDTVVYVWVLANGVMDTTANGGIMIYLFDGTNGIGYHVAGSDKAAFRHENGSVGWQCLVLDTAQLPTTNFTVNAGAEANLNLANITRIGAGFKTLAKAVGGARNCFVDIIRYGNDGIVVTTTGTNTGSFEDIALEDVSSATGKAYGIIRKLGSGLYGVQGEIQFGTGSNGSTCYFEDRDATLAYEDRFIGAGRYKFVIGGNDTGNTKVVLGNKVGSGDSATGVRGLSVRIPSMTLNGFSGDASASLIVSKSNTTRQEVLIYGSTFDGFSGGVTMSRAVPSGSTHEFLGNLVTNSGQILPGNTIMRDVTVSGYNTSGSGALLYDALTNIKYSIFRNNLSTPPSASGIEFKEAGSFTLEGLEFNNNDVDVINSSNGAVTASIVGGGTVPTVRNIGSSDTLVEANVQVTITGSGVPLFSGSEVRVYRIDNGTEVAGTENIGDGGSFSFSTQAGTNVYIVIHAVQYEYILINNYSVPSADTTLPVTQVFDRNYENVP